MARTSVTRYAAGIGLAGCLALAACTSGATPHATRTPSRPTSSAPATGSPTPTPSGVAPQDWPTFDHDAARSGVAPGGPSAAAPSRRWSASLDGAVYGQPLVIGDTVYAATENNTVYALRAADGRVLWRTHVATPMPLADLPCGDVNPLGITSTPVFDPATGSIYALAETSAGRHLLVGIDARDGATTLRRYVEPPRGTPRDHQQRVALSLLDGHVYVAFGGLQGDCGDYVGSVVSAPVKGTGPVTDYAVPTTRQGGVWAPGNGVVVGDRLLYSVGNGASTRAPYDGSDSVISLTPNLTRADLFAPSIWAADNASDLDLGSDSPALVGRYVVIAGKRGTGYVIPAGHLGGVGAPSREFTGCRAFGSAAVQASGSGGIVYLPCASGVTAMRISASGTPTRLWTTTTHATGSPVIGAGAVWSTDWHSGVLYELAPSSGARRAALHLGPLPHFASPAISRGVVYQGTMTGLVAVSA